MGVSRDTFYHYQQVVEQGDIDSLIAKSWGATNLNKRVAETAEKTVLTNAIEFLLMASTEPVMS